MRPRTRRVVLPNIEPIIVVAGSPPLHDPRWIYEPKFDGFRGVLYLCRGECYIRSKRGNVLRRSADLARHRPHMWIRLQDGGKLLFPSPT